MADETTTTETTETKTEDQPKYTDSQLNDIIAKKAGKEAAKLLQAAGIKDISELGELVKLKSQPAQVKTDTSADDPIKKEIEELKKSHGDLASRADRNEALATAMKAGVTDDATLERVVKLALSPAYEGTIAERIQKVVTEVPEFVKKPGDAFGVQTKKDEQDATMSVLNQARARAGLPVQK